MNVCEEKINYTISCEKRNGYQLHLEYKKIDLTFCQLLTFRKKILNLTTSEALETILENDNFVLLFVADNAHLIYLDIPQLLKLRDLVFSVFKQSRLV